MTFIMFDTPKKKVIIKDDKRLIVDFEPSKVSKPDTQDMDIGEVKKKVKIVKPIVKPNRLKKGKRLF